MDNQVKTIKDIARILKISPSTVSRVLNKSGYYSKDIEKQVLSLVEENGFVYNMSAKSLRNSKSYTIGLMVPDISNTFFSTMALIVEEYFNQIGYSLYICNTHTDPEMEMKHFNHFASNKVDGILCVSQMTKVPANFMQRNIPIVCLDRYPLCDFPVTKVITDDYLMSYQVGEYLVKLGCKNPLFLSGNEKNYVSHPKSTTRVYGFFDSLKKHGLSVNKENIFSIELSTDEGILESEALITKLIQEKKEFDSIFAVTDRFALGAIHALASQGVQVPEEVKVIGYDNSNYTLYTHPSISSVDRNLKLMTTTACDKLYDLIKGNKTVSDNEIIIPASIIERESTKKNQKMK